MARALRFEFVVGGFGAVETGGVNGDDGGGAECDQVVGDALAGRLVGLRYRAGGDGESDGGGDKNDTDGERDPSGMPGDDGNAGESERYARPGEDRFAHDQARSTMSAGPPVLLDRVPILYAARAVHNRAIRCARVGGG